MSAEAPVEMVPNVESRVQSKNSTSVIENGHNFETSSSRPPLIDTYVLLSMKRTVLLISTLTATVLVGSMNTGITIVGLAHICLKRT